MSVWSDMGVIGAEMRGVDPCTFLNTAYGFFKELRQQIRPEWDSFHLPDWDFARHRKAGDRGMRGGVYWPALERDLSFPSGYYGQLGLPIPESYWNSVPRWSEILTCDEARLIGEDILQSPYGYGARPAVMDPAWPVQRYKVIQKMRYITVPLNIRTKEWNWQYNRVEWVDYRDPSGSDIFAHSINRDDFDWTAPGRGGQYIQIEAQISEYWARENVVCKIGYEGGWRYSGLDREQPPPINGSAWVGGDRFLSGEYTGSASWPGIVRLFGAVDLSTHPDFERYFDINDNEEE